MPTPVFKNQGSVTIEQFLANKNKLVNLTVWVLAASARVTWNHFPSVLVGATSWDASSRSQTLNARDFRLRSRADSWSADQLTWIHTPLLNTVDWQLTWTLLQTKGFSTFSIYSVKFQALKNKNSAVFLVDVIHLVDIISGLVMAPRCRWTQTPTLKGKLLTKLRYTY